MTVTSAASTRSETAARQAQRSKEPRLSPMAIAPPSVRVHALRDPRRARPETPSCADLELPLRVGVVGPATDAAERPVPDVALEVPERNAAVDRPRAQKRRDPRPVEAPVDALAILEVEVAEERVLEPAPDEGTFTADGGTEADASDRKASEQCAVIGFHLAGPAHGNTLDGGLSRVRRAGPQAGECQAEHESKGGDGGSLHWTISSRSV